MWYKPFYCNSLQKKFKPWHIHEYIRKGGVDNCPWQGGYRMTIRLPFRTRPDVGPSGKVTILGPTRCSADRMKGYAERRNPHAPDMAGLYLKIAERYGVRGDVAFCQAMYDTRTWRAAPAHPPWRPFAHTIWGDGLSGWNKMRLEKQVELHIQYLHAFASQELPEDAPPLPAMQLNHLTLANLLGCAGCWEDLNGKWVIPGNRYGQDITAIWRNMMVWEGEGLPMMDGVEDSNEAAAGYKAGSSNADGSAGAGEDMEWLRSRGMLPSPFPHPERKVTWNELAQLLRRWETGNKA
jgi:hypothetical protein